MSQHYTDPVYRSSTSAAVTTGAEALKGAAGGAVSGTVKGGVGGIFAGALAGATYTSVISGGLALASLIGGAGFFIPAALTVAGISAAVGAAAGAGIGAFGGLIGGGVFGFSKGAEKGTQVVSHDRGMTTVQAGLNQTAATQAMTSQALQAQAVNQAGQRETAHNMIMAAMADQSQNAQQPVYGQQEGKFAQANSDISDATNQPNYKVSDTQLHGRATHAPELESSVGA